MKTVIFLITILSISSCRPNREPIKEAVSIDAYVDLTIKNNAGQDLLDPNTPNTLNTNNIKLYNVVNGQAIEVYHGNYTYPKNYLIYNYKDVKAIRVFVNHTDAEELPTTYIKWNDNNTDTIKCHFSRGSGNDGSFILCDKVWYNSNIVFPKPENKDIGRFISLIK